MQSAEIVQSPRPRARGNAVDRLAKIAQGLPAKDAEILERIKAAAFDAVEELHQNVLHGEPREQAEAGRVLIGAYCQIREAAAELEPKLSTREARVAYMRAALRDPDDELQEAMTAERGAILAMLEGTE